jgi:hypothetical protein
MDKKVMIRIGMNNPDHISENLEQFFWLLKFIDADPGSGSGKFGSGMEKIWIWDKHLGSATLVVDTEFAFLACTVPVVIVQSVYTYSYDCE